MGVDEDDSELFLEFMVRGIRGGGDGMSNPDSLKLLFQGHIQLTWKSIFSGTRWVGDDADSQLVVWDPDLLLDLRCANAHK